MDMGWLGIVGMGECVETRKGEAGTDCCNSRSKFVEARSDYCSSRVENSWAEKGPAARPLPIATMGSTARNADRA